MEEWKILVLSLREIAKKKGMSINDLAEKLGKHHTTVGNFFLADNPPTLQNFLMLAELIGVKITMEGLNEDIIAKAKERHNKIWQRRIRIINELVDENQKDEDLEGNSKNDINDDKID